MKLKLFNKWDSDGIQVEDPGLKDYITLKPQIIPRTFGRNASTRFHKSKYTIVERLINKIGGSGHRGKKHRLTSGHFGGKGVHMANIVEKAFDIIEKKTNQNPIMVFVRAVENAAPREEITTIEYGGARYPQAVDCAPQRRIDLALKLMAQSSYQKSFNKKRKIHETLADEIIKAYNMDNQSQAIAKKIEVERQADSSR